MEGINNRVEDGKMRILYIGCVQSSYAFLEALISVHADIVGVITKKEAGNNSDYKDIVPLCQIHKIPYIYVKDINEKSVISFLKSCQPDIGFCFGWSQLIKENIIELFPKGMIGYHPAALPNNRGRHPIIWALVLGLEKTASTFFKIEKTADTGVIYSQEEVLISYEDTAQSLMDKLLEVGKRQIICLKRQLESGTVDGVSQSVSVGNSWRKREKIDGQIDWRMSSKAIYDLVRALTKPYVGAHFVYKEAEIKVWKVKEIQTKKYKNIEPGKVVKVNENGFIVKTGDNLIEVLDCDSIQLIEGEYL